jgi:LacI family transcriptional regulator
MNSPTPTLASERPLATKSRVTQADVARKAGVHVTTVSLALRNSPNLPLETRRRLQSLAEQMGYRPDPDLSALIAYRKEARQRKRTVTLAYITNAGGRWGWKSAPAHAKFFDSASARAEQLGYQLEHFWLGEPSLTSRRLGEILFSRGINGVILASQWAHDGKPVEFDWPHFSAVKIDLLPQALALHTVTNDQRAIVQLAVRRALAAGYQRIGLVMPDWWDEPFNFALSGGFLAEQARLPASDQIPVLLFSGATKNLGAGERVEPSVPPAVLQEWLRDNRVEVLLSYSPFVMPALAALKVRVPEEVAFIDLYLFDTEGHTAGVRHNCQRVGELAVEILASQLQQHVFGLPQYQTTTLVDGTWFEGTTLPPRR